jgi:hypothetical protein
MVIKLPLKRLGEPLIDTPSIPKTKRLCTETSRFNFTTDRFWLKEHGPDYFYDIEDRIMHYLEKQKVTFGCSEDIKLRVKSSSLTSLSPTSASHLLKRRSGMPSL